MPVERYCYGCGEFHEELTTEELMELLKYASIGMLIVWMYNRRKPKIEPRLEAWIDPDKLVPIDPQRIIDWENEDHD